MKLINYSVSKNIVKIGTDEGIIRVYAVRDDTLRITATKQEDFSPKPSRTVVNQSVSCQLSVILDDRVLIVRTPKVTIRVNRETCSFSYYDAKGRLLVKEPDGGGKFLEAYDLKKMVFDRDSKIERTQSADGLRIRAVGKEKFDRRAWRWKLAFQFDGEEALYGLGSHEEGIMNLRGHCQYLYQENQKIVIPAFVSTNGYGFFFDNSSYMTFHDDVYGSYVWADAADEIDYYFFYGPEFDGIISAYRNLTGGCPMFPKSTFGYIQSKERYASQEEILETARKYRSLGIPLDMIVLDWKSWEGDLWGEKIFDSSRFPDPAAMTAELHRLKIRFMISIWPIMNIGGRNHKEMMEAGCLLGNCATYDAFSDKARKLYWKQAREGLFSKGIDAWWCDCTEPFEADWHGRMKPEPEQRVVMNAGEAKKYLDPAEINAYSLLHSKGVYEGQRACTGNKRVVNLTRSSFAGQHRYATIAWSGDIPASWDTLKKQIPAGLNFCVTGEPYWTLDIGAFFVKRDKDLWFWNGCYDKGCEDLGYRELYVRFLELGAFLPVFRSHGTDTPREVWNFGKPGEMFYDAIVRFIRLRYRFLPYIYSLAAGVSLRDGTFLRMLPFDFRADPNTYNIGDEYLFGPSVLVCPVTRPMYYRENSVPVEEHDYTRKVYLPKGCGWYDFWTDRYFDGGASIRAAAEIDRIPLFVRAGSVIPFGNDAQNAEDSVWERVSVYPGADAAFTLYDDAGDNYEYEKGSYSAIEILWDEQKRALTIGERKGGYPEMPSSVKLTVSLRGGVSPVEKQIVYEGRELTVPFG